MRCRTSLDSSPEGEDREEWLENELRDCRATIDRYERINDQLRKEKDDLRKQMDAAESRKNVDRPAGAAVIQCALRKRTKNKVVFKEQDSQQGSSIIGDIYVQKSWLRRKNWQSGEAVMITIRLSENGAR